MGKIIRNAIILIRWCIGLVLVTFGFLTISEFTIAALIFLSLGTLLLYYADIKQSLAKILK